MGSVLLRIDPDAGAGIAGWRLSGSPQPGGSSGDAGGRLPAAFDGLPTGPPAPAAAATAPAEHPNGTLVIDHVVALTDELERTAAALEAAGAPLRRVREAGDGPQAVRQGFFRLGDAILEVVEAGAGGEGPRGRARFWGITFTVADLERCADLLGDRLGRIREAVQPGRRIAPVRREAGLGLAVAFMTRPPNQGAPRA